MLQLQTTILVFFLLSTVWVLCLSYDVETEGDPRWATLPQFNISVYMNVIFEPHNALVHASQNFLNFCMGTLFWVSAAALYYKVNPIAGSRREDLEEEYFASDDLRLNEIEDLPENTVPYYYKLPKDQPQGPALKTLVNVLRYAAKNVKKLPK